MSSNAFAALSDPPDPSATTETETSLSPAHSEGTEKPSPFVGLLNQGATCYLNSLIQGLFMIPELRRALYELDESDLGVEGGKVRKVPRELIGLFGRLQSSPLKAVGTAGLTQSFGWENKEAPVQQDVCELNRLLVDAVERSLKGTKLENLMANLYSGLSSMQTRCLVCDFISQRQERFYDITLSVAGYDSLNASLAAYLADETLDGRNQYLCSRCGKKVDAKRGVRLIELPPILTFSLLRFNYNWDTNTREKINTSFAFPLVLDGSSLLAESVTPGSIQYDLASVVIHRGGAFQGHYHSFVKDFCKEADWVAWMQKTSSSSSSASSSSSSSNPTQPPADPRPVLALFYSILVTQPSKSLYFDEFLKRFAEVSGMSWKLGYKDTYGGIEAFISKHPRVLFHDKKTKVLHLQSQFVPPKEDEWLYKQRSEEVRIHLSKLEIQNGEQHAKENGETSTTTAATTTTTTTTTTTITSTSPTEIKDPPVVNAPPPFGELDPGWFNFDDATVKPIKSDHIKTAFGGGNAKECAYMLVYRRRTAEPATVPPLPAYIREKLEKDMARRLEEKKAEKLQKEALNLSGLWLSEGAKPRALFNITSSVTCTLSELKMTIIERLVQLGEWNAGGEDELDLHMIKGGSLFRLSGNSTLKDAGVISTAEILAERAPPPQAFMAEVDAEGIKTRATKAKEKDTSRAAAEFNRRKDLTRITVLDCREGNPPDSATSLTVYVGQNKIVSSIRAEVCDLLGVPFDRHTRFKNTATDKLVTDESRTPSELKLKSALIFESGSLPSSSEIYLRISQVFSGVSKQTETRGLVCNLLNSVRDIKTQMKVLWGVPPDQESWVRKAGADGKPGLVCYDEDQPLSFLQCAVNEILYLEMEKVPLPGQVNLKVYLKTKLSLEKKIAPDVILDPFGLDVDDLVELGEVEATDKTTFRELKHQLLTLGMLNHLHDIKQLRVSALSEQKMPMRIFKSETSTLKEGKLKHGDSIMVETLDSPENIPEKSTLFLVTRRVKQGETWHYVPLPPVEIFLKKDELTSVDKLKQQLHAALFADIPLDKMILAHYLRRDFKWKVLNGPQNNKKKQKKKPVSVEEIKQMGDRTVLAVKNKAEETSSDDFRTEYDRVQSNLQPPPESNKPRAEGPALTIDCDFD